MEEKIPRKLAAILYADVAGYGRLTGEDEEGTHRVLSEYLDLFTASIEGYEGRVVHFAGDAILAEFPGVSQALTCAAAVQRDLQARNAALPDERRVRFRTGVNLGEVIVDRDDLYGDGVNVAARLEALAEPGGICVSKTHRYLSGRSPRSSVCVTFSKAAPRRLMTDCGLRRSSSTRSAGNIYGRSASTVNTGNSLQFRMRSPGRLPPRWRRTSASRSRIAPCAKLRKV